MSSEPDPEVLADLRLRESSQFDSSRTRTANYDWRKPADVDEWPCRACGVFVGVTDEATHALEVHNRRLLQLREAPVESARVLFCPSCKARGVAMQPERNRKHVDALAELIREFKSDPPPHPDREAELVAHMRLMHHPDVDGLVQAVKNRRENSGATSRRRKASNL